MLPNILMNLLPMSSPISANGFPASASQSETVGFDFNNYLLGLQTQATDGSVDWSKLVQSSPFAELQKENNGTEANTVANPMGALGALFQVPAQPGNFAMGQAPAQTPLDTPQALNVGNSSHSTTPAAVQGKVDWKSMGLTQINPQTIQEQGWDMNQVEKLFANRQEDLSASMQLPEELGPVRAKLETPLEQVKAFQSEPLTAHQPVMHLTQKSSQSASQVPSSRVAPENAAGVVIQDGSSESASSLKPSQEKNRLGLGQVESKGEGKENSVFSMLIQNSNVASNKTESFQAVAPQPSPASQAPVEIPEWVSRTEGLAQQGGGKMTLALTPPELGKVEIEVVTRGKNVEVEIRSENDGARKALESGLNDLKSALLGQDLVLSKSEVKVGSMERFNMESFQNPNHTANNQSMNNPYTSQDRQQSFGNSQGFSERSGRWEFTPGKSTESIRTVASRGLSVSDGRIDVRI